MYIEAGNQAQLLVNPDFYDNPSGWFCSPGSYLDCSRLPGDSGSSGGVASISGSIQLFNRDTAFILQEVTIPSGVTITSAVVEARLRLESGVSLLANWIVGIYDPATSNFYYYYGMPDASYTIYILDFTTVVSPGSTYYVMVGLDAQGLFGLVYDLRVDWVYLNITTSEYTFSNSILALDARQDVYAWLQVESLSGVFNAEIRISNMTTVSDPIVIDAGTLINRDTSVIRLSIPPSGYYSGYIDLDVAKASPGIHTVDLTLSYCTIETLQGACVSYPLRLEIDPPIHRPQIAQPDGTGIVVNVTSLDLDNITPIKVDDNAGG